MRQSFTCSPSLDSFRLEVTWEVDLRPIIQALVFLAFWLNNCTVNYILHESTFSFINKGKVINKFINKPTDKSTERGVPGEKPRDEKKDTTGWEGAEISFALLKYKWKRHFIKFSNLRLEDGRERERERCLFTTNGTFSCKKFKPFSIHQKGKNSSRIIIKF